MYSTSMVWLNTADRPNPRVAITAPLTDVALSPILSERMPAKNERKNVDPIAREPTNAEGYESSRSYVYEPVGCL